MELNYLSMDEYFLHFLWKYQKFTELPLIMESGEELVVLKPGFHNQNSGPDFSESQITIADIEWSGSVEIHYRASDWEVHKHNCDPAYENVILHVVWINDKPISYSDGKTIPTLVISRHVAQDIEQHYRNYINQPKAILCDQHLPVVPSIKKTAMLDHALMDRLESKAKIVMDIYKKTNSDWNETAYQILGRNFGFSVNKEAFERLTTLLPYKIIGKHIDQPKQVHALLFGMAGFLENDIDDGVRKEWKIEFDFLQKKYALDATLLRHNWKFSKLRPANFPTVRLAQFAAFLINQKKPFSLFIETTDIAFIRKSLHIHLVGYWEKHYDFGKTLSSGLNHFGQSSIDNILINTAVPLLTAYSKSIGEQSYLDRAVEILSQLKPEKNKITRAWEQVGLQPSSAFDSQALIQQYNAFCLKKKCLQCSIGVSILSR